MNEFKYQFINLILLAVLGAGIYWAFTTIDNGISYDKYNDVVATETIDESGDVEEVVLFDNTKQEESVETAAVVEEPIVSSTTQDLINDLDKIISANIILKKGSKGDNVIIVQKFLDTYFTEKNISADGDFGPGTESIVKEFQQKELNGGDGRVGPNTAKKMIEILKK